jgi:hydrogenase maturation protease
VNALSSHPKVVVAGLGSAYRGDDAVGPLVAALAVAQTRAAVDIGPVEDPMDLLTSWDGADLAVVVDAVRAGGRIGRVSSIELDDAGAAMARGPSTSTHGIGLAGVLRLARAVGRSPRRVVLVAVEGEDFSLGQGLSVAVAAAVPDAVRRVVELIEEVGECA